MLLAANLRPEKLPGHQITLAGSPNFDYWNMLRCNAIDQHTALNCNNGKLNGIGTRPGCDAPGYHSVVHHAAQDWKNGGTTNIQDLTLACPPDNQLIETGGWNTRILAGGQTQWIPPPGLPMLKGGTNDYHHPERLLPRDDEKD